MVDVETTLQAVAARAFADYEETIRRLSARLEVSKTILSSCCAKSSLKI